MPWCPKCKNEYKAGFSICADCGCGLMEELGPESIALIGSEEDADKLLAYLDEKGFDFPYKNYNNKEGYYEVIIQESMIDSLRPCMKEYYEQLESTKANESKNDEIVYINDTEDELVLTRYKKPAERALEYKAGAATLLFIGIVGVIALILIEIGIIPLSFSIDRKVLIYTVMGGTFILFTGLGISSFLTYKKLMLQAKEDDKLEEDILKWFSENVSKEDITKRDNAKEAEEVLYFNRIKIVKRKIVSQFSNLEPAFVEYLSDKIYNDMFK